MSGGLPHSEIRGSKPIPGSPLLIAGYHVLHRLLLPRHPPNALLALDPIRRRTGTNPHTADQPKGALLRRALTPPNPAPSGCRAPVGSHTYPAPRSGKTRGHGPRPEATDLRLVYLTWNKTAADAHRCAPRPYPHSGKPAVLMFLSLHDCQTPRPTGRPNPTQGAERSGRSEHGSRAISCKVLVGRGGLEPPLPCRASLRLRTVHRTVRSGQGPTGCASLTLIRLGGSRRNRTSDLTLIRRTL